ncbi:MAG: HEPN domain-containing protein [Chloroflexi bacterium]|nr:HEPN domain-containing protein [Chloroflexota bacterium]
MAKRTEIMGQRMWRQAESDLASARMMMQPGGFYVAANLAHQAAEKALKAAHWYIRGEEPPWTHHIRDLPERIVDKVEDIPSEILAEVAALDPMFERSRYPSSREEEPIPVDLVAREDAEDAIQAAEGIMAWLTKLLQASPN